ncbi:hypothetical protein KCTCHS21_40070 [Cohnella abietis]|uniref:Uncharacterized protein n=2 Tax=Cohnella abietis TaxID=2507935 RepID=A0A3T1D9D4_9BACL|nr:hypothetical protein KCTCHS21_40070 [Cohnella abietis]
MDVVYSGAIQEYSKLAKDNQRLFVENWSSYEEPVIQSNLLLKELLNKKNLEVVGMADLFNTASLTNEVKSLYQVKNISDRNKRPQIGDFVLVITGNKPAYWNIRGVAPFNNTKSILLNTGWDLQLSASDQINKSLFYMDMHGKPKYGLTYFGYQLYKITGEGVLWEGRFEDGWIGKKAECSFLFDTTSQSFKITVPNVNVPNKLSILNNNHLIKEIKITNEGVSTLQFEIESQPGETVNLQFVLDKSFIPKQMGINNDDRTLGIQIEKIKTN